MENVSFELIPYRWDAGVPPVLQGQVLNVDDRLRVAYRLTGGPPGWRMPERSLHPERRWKLWRQTCFELFWRPFERHHYWELNASCEGHWNVFAFSGYRQGMAEEHRMTSVVLETRHEPDGFYLACEMSLGTILTPGPLRLGPAAVLVSTTGQRTYWALSHEARGPDFHRLANFGLQIET